MNGCCCSCCPPDTRPPEPPDGRPPPSQRCELYQLTIVSMNVSQVDDGFLGGDLEATFIFTVNGESRTWVNNDLGTGTHSIGITFLVPVPADSSTITLSVSGEEEDTFVNDTLAGFTQVWGQAQNWGVGAQAGSASDSNITYTLNYTITCARGRVLAMVSRTALLAYGRQKAERRKAVDVSETTLVAWSIDRLRRDGWEVITATDREFIFRGVGTLAGLVERKLGRQRQEDKAG